MSIMARLSHLASHLRNSTLTPDKVRNEILRKIPSAVKAKSMRSRPGVIVREVFFRKAVLQEDVTQEFKKMGFKPSSNKYSAPGTDTLEFGDIWVTIYTYQDIVYASINQNEEQTRYNPHNT